MAKSESTAVNELISLVQGGAPMRDEPSDDLFGSPKGRMGRSPGEVVPLPPQRAPTGTSQMLVNKQVRMTTAPPTRATTIPPLPQRRASSPGAAKAPPPPRPSAALPPRPSGALPPLPRAAAAQSVPARSNGARGTGTQRTSPPATTPVAAPFEHPSAGYPVADRPAIDKTGDAVSADNWFEASRMVEKIDETYVGTQPAPKRTDPGSAIAKLLLPLVVLAVVSAGVAYVVFSHHAVKTAPPVTHVVAPVAKVAPAPATVSPAVPSTESANAATATAGGSQPEPPAPGAAPAPTNDQPSAPNANDVKIVFKGDSAPAAKIAAAPAPAPAEVPAAPVAAAKVAAIADAAPVVHEVPTAHGVVKLVDVRIDSKPAGATVMLVDNGKTSFLGTTPVAASVDPSRSYDVVLTLDGRPTQMAHLDPTKAQKLEITLSKTGAKAETPKAAPAVKADAAPKTAPKAAPARKQHVAASGPSGGLVDPGFDAPAAPKADAGGQGTLMVSSKPPCEIWIDGTDTGLTTPQRSMSLPAGSHKVTFVNSSENITKTVSVKITADQPTKLIQNLMAN